MDAGDVADHGIVVGEFDEHGGRAAATAVIVALRFAAGEWRETTRSPEVASVAMR